MKYDYDIAVIGGGTAGLVTASGCARLGRRVALIEREALGGDCLWTGCVPTKALVATARLVDRAAHAYIHGLDPHAFEISPGRVLDSMREAQRVAAKHDDPGKFRRLGIDVITGEAAFVSPRAIRVDGREIAARDFVIATGSRTSVPPVPGLVDTTFLDHASFLRQDRIPESCVILGGGAIGIEFAQLFRRLGTDVTVVELADDILGREDRDAVAAIRAMLEREGIVIRSGWKAVGARRDGRRKVLTIESGAVDRHDVAADEIFVASGRRGNIESLGLENAGVSTDRSYVVVDRWLRTTASRIWACGDVHGGPQFTHVAAHEAVTLVRNMLFPGKSAVDYANIPTAIYTDPEFARIGITESEAIAAHGASNVRAWRVDMEDVDRAVVDRTTEGFVKIVTTRRGKILGAHILAPDASTLIQQIVVARSRGMSLAALARLPSAYPSLADAIGKAGALYYQEVGKSWLGALARRIARWSS
jgi:pyruvate/2-oxoglutarate dehydrogenase complex dihydrolipoamide dehydrogenase (E3) component